MFALKELIKNAGRQTPCVTTLKNKELNHSVHRVSGGILLSSLLGHNELSSRWGSMNEKCLVTFLAAKTTV